MQCWQCHAPLDAPPPGQQPGRGDTCPACHAPTHCCCNCRFHDPTAHHECRESQAEWVKEKDRANFCDYFDVATAPARGPGTSTDTRESAEERWARITKKGAS